MPRANKIGRNDSCPCQSGRKFKRCCENRVDWDAINRDGADYRPYLSVRGRNLYFAARIAEALQLDRAGKTRRLSDYKAAFTTAAVRKIHEAIMEIWPPDINITEVLERVPGDVSGLYIGDYGPEHITRGIVRHSIYANKILLFDPFVYPKSVRDEFNPILNPGQYRTQTLKNVNLWFDLLPWIDAEIVEIIRPPSDFDHKLNWDFMKAQERKFAENPELQSAMKKSVDELSKRHTRKLMYQQLLLGAPDSYLRSKCEELGFNKEGVSCDEFIKSVHEERERDPDFLEPLGSGEENSQLFTLTSGACYPSAKLTANITGSYLFSDLYVRWKELELDRESQIAANTVWAPFAKALQDAPLRYLNSLRLDHALMLRKEGRLESLRGFLAKVWKEASTENQFDNANAVLLAEELGGQIREAEQEWDKIDVDLLKIVGGTAVAELLAAGPLIAAGHAFFLAAAVFAGGGLPVVHSTVKRRSFQDRFPAAFFMKIEDNEESAFCRNE